MPNDELKIDFIIGDMLGLEQSGLKDGFTISPNHHWNLLEAATKVGRRLTSDGNDSIRSNGPDSALIRLIDDGHIICTHFDRSSASTKNGFALRTKMALFADWKGSESTINAMNTLESLESTGEPSPADNYIQAKVIELAQSIIEESLNPQPTSSDKGVDPVLLAKPQMSGAVTQVSRHITEYYVFAINIWY